MPLGARITQLQVALSHYGEASIRNYQVIQDVGEAIITGFEKYLGEGSTAIGVPPTGEWDPNRGPYRDAKFSAYDDPLLAVGPISMGLAIRVPHTNGPGETWLRVPLSFEIDNQVLSVQVGDSPGLKKISLKPQPADLERIYDMTFEYLTSICADPVNLSKVQNAGKIGFLTHSNG